MEHQAGFGNSTREMRRAIRQFWTARGFPEKEAIGLISPVFPGEFNMSGGHNLVLPALKSADKLRDQISFFVLEHCLRRLDLPIVGYSPFHLSLLEMAVSAIIAPSGYPLPMAKLVQWIVEFLETQGVRRERLLVTCTGGGVLGDFHVDPDIDGHASWIKAGVPSDQVVLIPGERNLIFRSGDFHPTFGKGPRPAGIVHEIFYPIEGDSSYVELASINLYTHIQTGKNVQLTQNRALGVGFGLERLAAVKNHHRRVFELDSLAACTMRISSRSNGMRPQVYELLRIEIERLADRIRAICFAVSEGQNPDKSPRGLILSDIIKGALKIASHLGTDLHTAAEAVLFVHNEYSGEEYPRVYSSGSYILSMLEHWNHARRMTV
jgi:alanyl-tRNA synthetase